MAAYWIARANLRDLKSLDRYAEIVAGLERRYHLSRLRAQVGSSNWKAKSVSSVTICTNSLRWK